MHPCTLGKDRSRDIRCNGILFQGSVLGRSHRRICLEVPSLPGLIVIAPASERQDGVACLSSRHMPFALRQVAYMTVEATQKALLRYHCTRV